MSANNSAVIVYRQLEPQDLPGMRAINDECFPGSEFPDEWYCQILTDNNSYSYGAFDKATEEMVGMIIGQTQCVLEAEEEVDDLMLSSVILGEDNFVYIPIFGVLKSYRRLRIGSNLMQKLLFHVQTSRKTKAVYLHVESKNSTAITFYEKFGFHYFKLIHGYYYSEGINDHALIYILYMNNGKPYMGGPRAIVAHPPTQQHRQLRKQSSKIEMRKLSSATSAIPFERHRSQ